MIYKKSLFSLLLCFLVFSASFGANSSAYGVSFNVESPFYENAFNASGQASWYGPRFHGRTTANGELYNMYGLTAAHKTLPFGLVLHVTNKKNEKSVLVQVNDRGPYVGKRIIDLSKAAMNLLAGDLAGVIDVDIIVVSDKAGLPLDPSLAYYVQCSKSLTKEEAEKELAKLHKVGIFDVGIFSSQGYYLVGKGPFDTFQEAQDELIHLTTIFPLTTIELASKQLVNE